MWFLASAAVGVHRKHDACILTALDSKLICWGGSLAPPADLRIAF